MRHIWSTGTCGLHSLVQLTLSGHPRLGVLSRISDGSEPLDRPEEPAQREKKVKMWSAATHSAAEMWLICPLLDTGQAYDLPVWLHGSGLGSVFGAEEPPSMACYIHVQDVGEEIGVRGLILRVCSSP